MLDVRRSHPVATEAALTRSCQILAAAAALALAAPACAAPVPPDRLAIESLLIRAGFSGAAVTREGPVWQGEGDRDGRLLRFVVEASGIRILDSREGGGGPIGDRP